MKPLQHFLAVAGFLCAPQVFASSSYMCSGKIDNFQVAANGVLQIMSTEIYENSTAGRTLCNLNSPWKGVSIDVCKVWASMITVAQTTGKPVQINYVDEYTCASQPTWGNANAPFLLDRQ